jgi:hypothetical protein
MVELQCWELNNNDKGFWSQMMKEAQDLTNLSNWLPSDTNKSIKQALALVVDGFSIEAVV